MTAEVRDIIAGFVSMLFILPIIIAIEWDAESVVLWFLALVFLSLTFGLMAYLTFHAFGVQDGLYQGRGTRSFGVRWTILLGVIIGAGVDVYILKPMIYYLAKRLKNRVND